MPTCVPLVSGGYECAALVLTSNLPFLRLEHVFGDQVVAKAIIGRIVLRAGRSRVHRLTVEPSLNRH